MVTLPSTKIRPLTNMHFHDMDFKVKCATSKNPTGKIKTVSFMTVLLRQSWK